MLKQILLNNNEESDSIERDNAEIDNTIRQEEKKRIRFKGRRI